MSSSVFGQDVTTYAPGASVIDPNNFLANFTGKKIKKSDLEAFQEAGGNMDKFRKQMEKGKFDDYKIGDKAQAFLTNQTADINNVPSETNGQFDLPSFFDEFASGKGKISKSDIQTFEGAGGDLERLQSALAEGDMYVKSDKEQVFEDKGGIVPFGNEDNYGGGLAIKYLEKQIEKLNNKKDPGTGGTDPVTGGTDPVTGGTDPVTGGTDPVTGGTDPVTGGTDPVTGGTDPVTGGIDPGTGGTDPGTGGIDPGTGGTDPGTGGTTPETGGGNPNPETTDPTSGFPYNPGTHPGNPFTDYQDNIDDIKDETDERLEDIDRLSPEDTLTQDYTQQLIEGGILPGTPGYVSAAEKDADRLEGDLALKDAFSSEVTTERREAFEKDLEMAQRLASERSAANSEALWGEGGRWETAMSKTYRPTAPTIIDANTGEDTGIISILGYLQHLPKTAGDFVEPGDGDGGGDSNPDDNDINKMNYMPDLPDEVQGDFYSKPNIYTDGPSAPEYNKKVSWDGGSFQKFLSQVGDPIYRPGKSGIGQSQINVISPEKNDLYQRLKDAGLSDEDMKEAARAAGLTNVNTGKRGQSDFDQIIEAYNNNFYKNWDSQQLRTPEDLYGWYEDKGGEKSMQEIMNGLSFNNVNTKGETKEFAKYLTKDLKKSGITMDPDAKSMKQFEEEMAAIADMFGGKYTFKTYQEALKGNEASEVNDWLTQYMNLGGGIGKRVIDALNDQN